MGAELPPSKFGAGVTYGGDAQPVPTPTTAPNPMTHASALPAPPPDPVGYAPTYPVQSPTPQIAGYASAPAYPAAYPMKQQYAGSGGTAITAAVLSFIGVLYNGFYAALGAASLVGLAALTSSPGTSAIDGGTVAGAVVLDILMTLGPILLLIGGIQLLRHRIGGRRMIVTGCVLTIATQVAWALALFGLFELGSGIIGSTGTPDGTAFSQSFHTVATTQLLITSAPALGAIVTIVLALTPATRRWCRPVPAAYTP